MVVLWSGPLFYVFYVLVFYPKSLHSSLVQGVECFFVFGLLFLSQYKDTQLSCVFEKKNTTPKASYVQDDEYSQA